MVEVTREEWDRVMDVNLIAEGIHDFFRRGDPSGRLADPGHPALLAKLIEAVEPLHRAHGLDRRGLSGWDRRGCQGNRRARAHLLPPIDTVKLTVSS